MDNAGKNPVGETANSFVGGRPDYLPVAAVMLISAAVLAVRL